jgi:hypothetical protein
MKFCELIPDLPLALRQFLRNIYLHDHVEIAAFSGNAGQALSAQSKSLTALGPGWNFQANFSFERCNFQFRSQYCLPGRDLRIVNEIAAFDREIGMLCQTHPQKKVAAFSATGAGFTLTGQPNALPFMHALRNLDLIAFDFI